MLRSSVTTKSAESGERLHYASPGAEPVRLVAKLKLVEVEE